MFDLTDSSIIANSMAAMVDGWSANRISILSSVLDSNIFSDAEASSEASASARRLSTFTHDISFEVTFESEQAFGVDGTDFAALNNLVDEISSALSAKMLSGDFMVSLTGSAALANVALLQQVQQADVVSLEVKTVTYVGVENMKESSIVLPTYEETYMDSSSSSYDYTTITMVMSAGGIAFVAFVGIIGKAMSGEKYENLPQDSAHARATENNDYVGSIEMDNTISNPLGRNAVMDVNVARVQSTL
jgi:hypothetical protein